MKNYEEGPSPYGGPRRGQGFAGRGRGGPPGFGPGGPRGRRGGGRGRRGGAERGDVRTAVLLLLADEPMHGYQIMNEISERTNGAWQPSPGSVYPLLSQLTDEGLVDFEQGGSRKVFRLTPTGEQEAEAAKTEPSIWDRFLETSGNLDLRETIGSLAMAAKQVQMTGTKEQAKQAGEILADARKQLYLLLAE